MEIVVDILTWLALVVGGLAVTGGVLVAALAWLLNHPVDEDKVRLPSP